MLLVEELTWQWTTLWTFDDCVTVSGRINVAVDYPIYTRWLYVVGGRINVSMDHPILTNQSNSSLPSSQQAVRISSELSIHLLGYLFSPLPPLVPTPSVLWLLWWRGEPQGVTSFYSVTSVTKTLCGYDVQHAASVWFKGAGLLKACVQVNRAFYEWRFFFFFFFLLN